jgi:hypothetical protein
MRLQFSLQERNRVCSCRNARTRRSSAETGIIDSPRPAGVTFALALRQPVDEHRRLGLLPWACWRNLCGPPLKWKKNRFRLEHPCASVRGF